MCFEYSPESFTGTELDFAVRVCDEVNRVWCPTPGVNYHQPSRDGGDEFPECVRGPGGVGW